MTTAEPKRYRLRIANGALLEAPVYEGHRRGKNWLAIIDVDGTAPGGLSRRFLPTARGECLYMVEQMGLFDPVEFAGDYITGVGTKKPNRWYGVVIAKTDDFIDVEEAPSGAQAVLLAKAKRTDPRAQKAAIAAERDQLLARAAKLQGEMEVLDAPEAKPDTPSAPS